jgi:hypothetical protein
MGAFREQMNAARQQLHDYMSVEVLYFEGPYDPLTTVVQKITVRIHDKFLALGDLKGTNFNYAEIASISPRMIFLRSEVEPQRDFYVSYEEGLAYRIDNPLEPDGLTQTAEVVRLRPEQTLGFPLPGAF